METSDLRKLRQYNDEKKYYNTIEYYNYKTIAPQDSLNKVKYVCLKTPFSDFILFIWIMLSFVKFELTIGQKLKVRVVKSDYKLSDLWQLIKDNYKQYIVLSLVIYLVMSVMRFI